MSEPASGMITKWGLKLAAEGRRTLFLLSFMKWVKKLGHDIFKVIAFHASGQNLLGQSQNGR